MLDRFDAALDPTFAPVDRARLIARLAAILPAERLITQVEGMRVYESDGLAAYRGMPGVVALPDDTAEVAAILRVCGELGVLVVARGAGTGLSGGALPFPGSVLLSLARLGRILSLDPAGRTARVQPGVRNLAISEAAAPLGLFYAPDPSSQLACSIGGNVAENAGGVHCLKYGLTVNNILGLEVVTLEGEMLRLGGEALDAPGFDLMALMTGSEGLLGVITEVTVKLLPIPSHAQVLLAAFADVRQAGEAVAAIIAAGIIPAGLEMMDNLALTAAERHVHAGYPTDAAAILLCEIDGETADVAADLERVRALCEAAGAREVRLARDEAERARFWAGRKGAFPAMGRMAPDYYCIDGTIPRRRLADVLVEIEALSAAHGLAVANVFHAGDGNLHPLILYDANAPGEMERAETLGGAILELCVSVGGTITGEHGVGREKINQMCVQFRPEEIEAFAAIKAAFDAAGLLNPGKAIPTLARCAEFGAMHVHRGELPFGHLHPRYAGLRGGFGRGERARIRRADRRRPRPKGRAAHRGRRHQGLVRAADGGRGSRRLGPQRRCSLRADRARHHRPGRHAAGRDRGDAGRTGPDPGIRASRVRSGEHYRRRRGGRTRRAGAAVHRGGARLRPGRARARRARQGPQLRRDGVQERGRFRRFSADGRRPGPPGGDPGGFAEGEPRARRRAQIALALEMDWPAARSRLAALMRRPRRTADRRVPRWGKAASAAGRTGGGGGGGGAPDRRRRLPAGLLGGRAAHEVRRPGRAAAMAPVGSTVSADRRR